ncbi:MAG: hypothetical protein ACRDTX_21495 [Pseudonocardiaceae bacterium]
MTHTATDDPHTLRHILTRTTALLLDFDGSACNVFAGIPATTVVSQLCVVLADGGHGDLPTELGKSDDPFEVLAHAASLGEGEARYVNAAFTAHELDATATAKATQLIAAGAERDPHASHHHRPPNGASPHARRIMSLAFPEHCRELDATDV